METRKVDFALTRVFYVFGHLEAQGKLSEDLDDLDKIEEVCVKIASDWENRIDIRDEEEEGYPTAYAERVLLEKYGK